MKILTVKQCCFCVDLKIAGITLGVLDILLHFYLICMEYFKVQNMYYSDPYYDPLWEGNAKAKWIIALNCIAIFVGACWIRGIFQEKPRLMLPTLFTTSVIIAYLIFSSIAALCASSQFDEYTIFEILVLLLLFHFWLVQYSLYKSIKDIDNNNRSQSRNVNENETP